MAGLCKQAKPKTGKNNNPTGKGGLGEHPERICRDGAAMSKGKQISNRFREWLESVPDGMDKPRLDTLLDYLWDIASAANKQSVEAIKLLMDRAYGRPVQTIAGDPDNPLFVGGISEAVHRANGTLSGAGK